MMGPHGAVATDSYAGRTLWPCDIIESGIGKKGDRTRVRMLARSKLPHGWVEAGAEIDVPTIAIVDYGVDPKRQPAAAPGREP